MLGEVTSILEILSHLFANSISLQDICAIYHKIKIAWPGEMIPTNSIYTAYSTLAPFKKGLFIILYGSPSKWVVTCSHIAFIVVKTFFLTLAAAVWSGGSHWNSSVWLCVTKEKVIGEVHFCAMKHSRGRLMAESISFPLWCHFIYQKMNVGQTSNTAYLQHKSLLFYFAMVWETFMRQINKRQRHLTWMNQLLWYDGISPEDINKCICYILWVTGPITLFSGENTQGCF